MDPLVVFALTSFLFLHIATALCLLYFQRKYFQAVQAATEYATSVQESLQRLQLLILQTSPLGMAAAALQDVPGAGPGLGVTQEGDSVSPPFPGHETDPDEDDDITTLGEMLG